jgi:hypothetical protein
LENRISDFGVIIACCRKDYHYTRGTVASVHQYMPGVPICLIIDGDFPVDDLKRAYNVQTLYRAYVKDDFLRTRGFGWGFSKNVALWESPFERFLLMDSDTVLFGDVRRKFPPDDQWDALIDRQLGSFNDSQTNDWFFNPQLVESCYPTFPWRKFTSQYFCPGVWACRRGAFSLDEYKDLIQTGDANRELFKHGDMGILNLLIFRAADEGRAKVLPIDLQVIVADYTVENLQQRFSITNAVPLKDPPDPVVLHYPTPKPAVRMGPTAAPMSYFRRQAAIADGLSALQAATRLLKEDIQYFHWPRTKIAAKAPLRKVRDLLFRRGGR